MKSSFLDKMSLLKVLQELLRPWYKSASNHNPNRPLKKKYTKKFRLYITVKILEAVGTTRAATRRNLGNSEDLLDWTWRAQSWQSNLPRTSRSSPLAFVCASERGRAQDRACACSPLYRSAVCTASCGWGWDEGAGVGVPSLAVWMWTRPLLV